MDGKLGICVVTKQNMTHLLGLTKAARKAGVTVDIFLTGEGIHLAQHESFPELVKMSSRLGICEVSYLGGGYKNKEPAGLTDKDFVTQLRNADMVTKCDRYLVL